MAPRLVSDVRAGTQPGRETVELSQVRRLANFAPDTVDDIRHHVRLERCRLTRLRDLLRSFFRYSALPFHV